MSAPKPNEEICPICKGIGNDKDNPGFPCKECDGAGSIASREKEE